MFKSMPLRLGKTVSQDATLSSASCTEDHGKGLGHPSGQPLFCHSFSLPLKEIMYSSFSDFKVIHIHDKNQKLEITAQKAKDKIIQPFSYNSEVTKVTFSVFPFSLFFLWDTHTQINTQIYTTMILYSYFEIQIHSVLTSSQNITP